MRGKLNTFLFKLVQRSTIGSVCAVIKSQSQFGRSSSYQTISDEIL